MSKVYLMYDNEISTLGLLNILSTVFFSLGISAWSAAIGIYASFLNYDHLNAESKVLMRYGPSGLFYVGILCLGATILTYWISYRTVRRIKKESTPPGVSRAGFRD